MIHEFVPIMAGELRDFLEAHFDTADDVVVLSNLVNQDGTSALLEENKVIVNIVNVERDGTRQGQGGGLVKGDIPVHINIYLLFAAHFADYAEALKFLSGVIGFFQGTPSFNIDGNIVKVELFNIDFRELSNLWASLGAKYMPSVLYRARTLNMDEQLIRDEIPPVMGITS